MTRTIRTDFVAYNGRGVQVRSFSDLAHARAWVRSNAHLHDDLHLQELQVIARPIYRPRAVRMPASMVAA